VAEVADKKPAGYRNEAKRSQKCDPVIAPNPTQSWATVTYTLQEEPVEGWIRVKDLFGRVVISERMAGDQGQVVLDTRHAF
jgi:hypothetical protein